MTINLPSQSLVAQLQPAPASPHILAVMLAEPSAELLIYDDAGARANALSSGAGTQMVSIAWGNDASTLYADILTTGVITTSIDTLSVTASGVSVSKSPTFNSISGSMHFVGGLLYFDGGNVFDPVAGAFATQFVPAGGAVSDAAFDSSLDRAYFVMDFQPQGSSSSQPTIEGFQLSTRKPSWVLPFPYQNPVSFLTRWGGNGLAFSDNDGAGSLVLLSGTIVAQ